MAAIHHMINNPWSSQHERDNNHMNNYSTSTTTTATHCLVRSSTHSSATVPRPVQGCWSSSSGVFNSASRSSMLNYDDDEEEQNRISSGGGGGDIHRCSIGGVSGGGNNNNNNGGVGGVSDTDGVSYMTGGATYYRRVYATPTSVTTCSSSTAAINSLHYHPLHHHHHPVKSGFSCACSTSTPFMLDDYNKLANTMMVDNGARAMSTTIYSHRYNNNNNNNNNNLQENKKQVDEDPFIDPDILMEFESVCDELLSRSRSILPIPSMTVASAYSEHSLLHQWPPYTQNHLHTSTMSQERLLTVPMVPSTTSTSGGDDNRIDGGGGVSRSFSGGGLRRSPGVLGVSDLVYKTDAELENIMKQADEKPLDFMHETDESIEPYRGMLNDMMDYADASLATRSGAGGGGGSVFHEADIIYNENWLQSIHDMPVSWLDKVELADIDECTLQTSENGELRPQKPPKQSLGFQKNKAKSRKTVWSWFRFCACVSHSNKQ